MIAPSPRDGETAKRRDGDKSRTRPVRSPSPAKTLWLGLFLLLAAVASSFSQDTGAVSGTVVSTWDGAPMPGVIVTVRGTTLATQTDAAGRYELKNVPAGDQSLRFSKPGFAAAVVTDVRVAPGQTTTVNGNLRPEFYEMEEFEVTAEEFTEQTEQIMFERKESTAMINAIGSEQFSKLGAGDAGQIVSRVTGVSVVGGKYAVVRGLSDRYTRTLLNGLEVPSADPYRMAPQLDLFPSAMIDQIAISKTFTPDQPGGTGGGQIDITTKSFPEKPFVKASVGTSYNENSNLKNNFLADPSSSMSMYDLPSGPKALKSELFGLTGAPNPPGPPSSRETGARAVQRRQDADAVQSLLQDLGTANFAGVNRDSPLNSSLGVSAGRTVPVFGRNLGVFGGMNYNRDFRMIEDATVQRFTGNGFPQRIGKETRGNILTAYGANLNLGYELSADHQVGFNFMLVNSVDEEARHATYPFVEGREDTLEQWQLHFTERQVYNYQLHAHHELPFLAGAKLDWAVGMADTSQDEPDHRFMNYFVTPDGQTTFGDASLPTPQFPARYFREIDEHSLSARVDWTQPFELLPEESRFKAGFSSSSTERDFREQYFLYNLFSGFDLQNPNTYLNDPAYLNYIATHLGGIRTNFQFLRFIDDTFAFPYTAKQEITAGYLMADLGLLSWLRLIGGVRLEQTLIEIDAAAGPSKIDQADLLPGAGIVIGLRDNLDLRLSYGQTVARPSFREMAPILGFLPDEGITALGNPEVQMTAITSYDVRLEWFPAPGEMFSLGGFFKELEQPIELYSRSLTGDQVTWLNRTNGTATVMGVEVEGRKSLEFITPYFRGLTLAANATLIKSETKLHDDEFAAKTAVNPNTPRTRPLSDQSPYIINLDLNYDHPSSGTSLVIGANMTGKRISVATVQGPDIYEHPPITLDAAISQRFAKAWTVRFGVKNLLDPVFRRTYGDDFNGTIFQSFKRGRTFSVSLSAEF